MTQDSLQSFLKVAEKLKIKGLCETLAPPPPPPPSHPPPLPPHVPLLATPTRKELIQNSGVVNAAQAGAVASPSPASGVMMPAGTPAAQPPPSAAALLPATAVATSVVNNFEGLLPRSPYIPEPSIVPLSCSTPVTAEQQQQQQVTVAAPLPPPPPSARPPPVAHQSPRASMSRTRSSTDAAIIHYAAAAAASNPKRPKYSNSNNTSAGAPSGGNSGAVGVSPQSILRNQLQIQKEAAAAAAAAAAANGGGGDVEVKSEPMAILSTTHEEVPSSGVNVTEFIATQDTDLASLPLGHGIPAGFMFSPDPAGQQQQQQEGGTTAAGGAVQHQQQQQHQVRTYYFHSNVFTLHAWSLFRCSMTRRAVRRRRPHLTIPTPPITCLRRTRRRAREAARAATCTTTWCNPRLTSHRI